MHAISSPLHNGGRVASQTCTVTVKKSKFTEQIKNLPFYNKIWNSCWVWEAKESMQNEAFLTTKTGGLLQSCTVRVSWHFATNKPNYQDCEYKSLGSFQARTGRVVNTPGRQSTIKITNKKAWRVIIDKKESAISAASTVYLLLLLKEKSYKQSSANKGIHKTLVSCFQANKWSFLKSPPWKFSQSCIFKNNQKTATHVWAGTT